MINVIDYQIGWGLRAITQELNPLEFDYLYSFFSPLGPMLRLCYRLLSEPIKFDVPIDSLPSRTIQMLNSGRFSVFYSDILSVDPIRRQVTSFHLNAFDYYIFHFAVHGMLPLHKMFPAALTVHNDLLKTTYYYLTADYLCTFLPSDPNATVMPANVFCSIKSAALMPSISPIMPMRTPKYLSSIIPNFTSSTSNIRTPESSRSSCWRTETVLHLFVDTWLRYDVDENPDLPSSEFIRVVRVLVKQLHAFANTAEVDVTPMAALRSLGQPMMNAQMNTFLRGIIHRWPLDSSFSVVLELWLCYIQPWRYTLNRLQGIEAEQDFQGQIPGKFERFIMDNSSTYTQIFIQLLPRFERLDFSSPKNVSMLYRLTKVFGQSNLPQLLRGHDLRVTNEHLTTSIKTSSLSLNVSAHSHPSANASPIAAARSHDTTDFFDSPSANAYLHRNDSGYLNDHDDNYVCMFGTHMIPQLQRFIQKLLYAREDANRLIAHLEAIRNKKYAGLVGMIKWYLLDDEDSENTKTLNDAKKIVETLEFIVDTFAIIFEEELPDLQEMINEHKERSKHIISTLTFDDSIVTDNYDSVTELTPRAQKQRVRSVKYAGDPLTLPATNSEVKYLVRLQYKISHFLNEKVRRLTSIGEANKNLIIFFFAFFF